MSILAAVAVPHPPVICEEVGHGREQTIIKTIEAYRKAMKFAASFKPDTVVLTTPHSELYSDYFHIAGGKGADGDLAQFGAPQVKIHADYDQEFVAELEKMFTERHFPAGTKGERNPALDHASVIPLKYLNEVWTDYKVVRIGLSGQSFLQHYKLGQMIREVSEKLGRRTVFIASGDLSHKLLAEGPYGYAKEGPEFDEKITEILNNGDFSELFDLPQKLCESAGECGHRSFLIMAGAFDGKSVKSELLSYEGPFGVGYGVAQFKPSRSSKKRLFGDQYAAKQHKEAEERRKKEDALVQWAHKCVETFVTTGKTAEMPKDLAPEMMQNRAGVFVSLHKNGQLRGCIGTFLPARENIALEIWHNAVAACSQDPRFSAVRPDELDEIEYSVDVLTTPQAVKDINALNPKVDGIIVQNGNRRGLLLPDIEGIDTLAQQVAIAKQKAGIAPEEPINLFSFQVKRHH